MVIAMQERDKYPNLPADVTIHHCTVDTPMPKGLGPKAAEVKQLWIHDDAEETAESMEMDGSHMSFICPHCNYYFTVFVCE